MFLLAFLVALASTPTPASSASPTLETITVFLPAMRESPRFSDHFDGDPAAPTAWESPDWDVVVHSRDNTSWDQLPAMQAHHGGNCEAPPTVHAVASYEDAVFQCRSHIMTAINGSGYGVIYRTPNHLVDFSGGSAVISFDASTLRSSSRDWIDIWITPFAENLVAPLESWLPDLNGEPRRAVHVRMAIGNGTTGVGAFEAELVRDFAVFPLPRHQSAGYETLFAPSASARTTFTLIISETRLRFGLPAYNHWWVDTTFAALGWTSGVVQFGHHSYNPTKDCPACQPNTWHCDNVLISPSLPFTIEPADQRFVTEGGPTVAHFARPAPAGAYLRFSGIGSAIDLSFNGGVSWLPAQIQAQENLYEDHFRTYWTPVPAGVTSVHFRGQEWWGDEWYARDISIWSLEGG
jgi:hypothetical protein